MCAWVCACVCRCPMITRKWLRCRGRNWLVRQLYFRVWALDEFSCKSYLKQKHPLRVTYRSGTRAEQRRFQPWANRPLHLSSVVIVLRHRTGVHRIPVLVTVRDVCAMSTANQQGNCWNFLFLQSFVCAFLIILMIQKLDIRINCWALNRFEQAGFCPLGLNESVQNTFYAS